MFGLFGFLEINRGFFKLRFLIKFFLVDWEVVVVKRDIGIFGKMFSNF